MDREKNIYILDRINHRVTKWNLFDENADTSNHRIVKVISPKQSSVICGSQRSANDQFNSPTGIFIEFNNGLKELFQV
mgnify:CR=1 FL=1